MAPKASLTQSDLFCTAEPDTGRPAAQERRSNNLPQKRSSPVKVVPNKGKLPANTTASVALDTGAMERFLSDHEVARRFEVSRATVWRWHASNEFFPQSIQISPGTTRWALSELMAFEARLRTSANPMKQPHPQGRLAEGGKL